jgi:hypothetical protein
MAVRGNPQRIFCGSVRWQDLDKASFEEIVGYFRKRVEDCFFNPAKNLLLPEYKTTGFVIVSIISTLIDLISQYYYHGQDIKHKDKYKDFLREHFPEFRQSISLKRLPHVKDFADFFYEGFRCQILHNFMLSEYSTIGWKTGITYLHVWDESTGAKELIINPQVFLEKLLEVFTNYTDSLLKQGNRKLREGFTERFFLDTGLKLKV